MKNLWMRVSNLALFLGFCGLTGTGLLMKYRLPPGSRGGHGLSALGMTRHEWGDIHVWIGWGVVAITLLHLALNWVWLRKIAGYRRWVPLLSGLAFGALIVVLPLILPVARQPAPATDHPIEGASSHPSH